MIDIVSKVKEGTFDYIVGEEGAEVTNVCGIVDGGSACVHGYLGGGDGCEWCFGAG